MVKNDSRNVTNGFFPYNFKVISKTLKNKTFMYCLNKMSPDVCYLAQNLLDNIRPALDDHESQLNRLQRTSGLKDQSMEIAWLFEHLISLREKCNEWEKKRQMPDDVIFKNYSSVLEYAKAMGDLCDESNQILTIHFVIKAYIDNQNERELSSLQQAIHMEQPKSIIREIYEDKIDPLFNRNSSIENFHLTSKLLNVGNRLELFNLELMNIIQEGKHAGLPGQCNLETRNAHENEILLQLISCHPPSDHSTLKILSLRPNLLRDWVFINKLVFFGYKKIDFRFIDLRLINETQHYVKLSCLIKCLISLNVTVDCTSVLSNLRGENFHCITAFDYKESISNESILEAKKMLKERSFLYTTTGEKSHIFENIPKK